MKKILGLMQQIPNPDFNMDEVYGRNIAIDGWLKALLKYGTFDEYHFYIPNNGLEQAKSLAQHWQIADSRFERIRIFPIERIKKNLSFYNYIAFHNPDILPLINDLASIRNKFACKWFPVTGTHHALSYGVRFQELLHIFMGEVKPGDTIISTSTAAKFTLEKMIARIDSYYDKRGIPLVTDIPITYIPLGVDSHTSFFPRDNRQIRANLNLPVEGVLFLWLGRFSDTDKADLSIIIRVFEKLIRISYNPTYLILAGDDKYEYSNYIEGLSSSYGISDNILIYRNPPKQMTELLYAASDVFLSPADSIQESFGITVLEAMASGLPVIVSDWSGYRDIVTQGETGYLVSSMWGRVEEDLSKLASVDSWADHHFHLAQSVVIDEDEMLKYMIRLNNSSELRIKLGEAGRKKVHELFDWSKIIRKYEDLWIKLSNSTQAFFNNKTEESLFSYYDFFSHYPSKMLSENQVVEKRDQKINYKSMFFLNPRLNNTVCVETINSIMHLINRPMSVSEIITSLGNNKKSSIIHSILWLIKYGYLQVKIK
ncbi:glycosyltransferase family 4 protein [Bacillus sp. SD088]|uniref:glycosyltransferase family 4 protein n=1 Tax=Bacillus sp. SD088 TaxID=2782012 RepID=UPI001A964B17|nr:glycosyltransferase family 4 protein [Bacillus sp. SD088]MBO0995913.1 glycosyltransferase family 4 protein [Bacillus sp. SD088]